MRSLIVIVSPTDLPSSEAHNLQRRSTMAIKRTISRMESNKNLSRRDFLQLSALASAGGLLAACAPAQSGGGTDTDATESDAMSPDSEGVVLNWAQASFWEERFTPAIERFKENHPQVTEVNFVSMSGMDHEEVYAQILSLFAAGDSIDMIGVNDAGLRVFWGKEMAHPLDEYVERDASELTEYFSDVHPILTKSALFNGSIWMLPWRWNGANMFLNMNMFEEAGIDYPADDWTKDDFYEIAKTLSQGEGADKTFGYSFVIRTWGGWLCWSFVNAEEWAPKYLEIERQPGGEWFWDTFYGDDPQAEGRGGGFHWGNPTANSAVNVEALEFNVQMHREGITPSVDVGDDARWRLLGRWSGWGRHGARQLRRGELSRVEFPGAIDWHRGRYNGLVKRKQG
ncbi:substrate-binding domain-containing protein [Chloroflexi bacterium TSY]|nr:substrate-binding domain-containing protein [Chloroflexi bacterium TSY]